LSIFKHEPIYFDAEFDADYDFAIKHQLKLRFDGHIDVQRQTTPQKLPNASILLLQFPQNLSKSIILQYQPI
jgi:hypothetical protein